MIRIKYILFFFILFNQTIICQITNDRKYIDAKLGNIRGLINSDGNSKEFLSRGIYILKDSIGRTLIDGNRSGNCGCEPLKNGFWLYYYLNGKIKEQGSYECGDKIGTWLEFYETGSIKKVVNLKKPYSNSLVQHFGDTLNLRRTNPMKSGQFLEYYEDGKIKTSGQYEILHIKSQVDSLVTVDKETYEKSYHKIEGEFWLPSSVKIGTWKYYSHNGEIEKIENYTLEEYDWRDLDYIYWELFNLFYKEEDTNKE